MSEARNNERPLIGQTTAILKKGGKPPTKKTLPSLNGFSTTQY